MSPSRELKRLHRQSKQAVSLKSFVAQTDWVEWAILWRANKDKQRMPKGSR